MDDERIERRSHRTLGGDVYDVRALAIAGNHVSLATEMYSPALLTWDLVQGRSSRVSMRGIKTWALVLTADARRAYFSDGNHVRVANTEPSPFGPFVSLFRRVSKAFIDHGAQIRTLVLSPDGQVLISSGHDDSIKAWAIDSGELLWRLPSHSKCAARAGAHGPLLHMHEESLIALDWTTGARLWSRIWIELHAITASADGRVVAAATFNSPDVHVWPLADEAPLPAIHVWGDMSPSGIALDSTGSQLAIGHGGRVSVLRLPSQSLRFRGATEGESQHHLAFMNDDLLVSAGRDVKLGPALHVWDLKRDT